MRAVNLLPREETRQRKQLALTPQNTPIVVGAGLGVVLMGALALGYMHESSAVSAAQQQLNEKKVELAGTPKPPPPTAVQVDPNAQLGSQQSARMAAVTTALGARFAWDRVLREFAQVLPDDVWLSSISFQTPQAGSPAGTSATTGVTIAGTTYSHDSVARLLARLALIPELSNVALQTDTQGTAATAGATSSSTPATPAAGGSAAAVTFTITASANLPAGATSLTPAPPPPPPAPTSTDSSGASS